MHPCKRLKMDGSAESDPFSDDDDWDDDDDIMQLVANEAPTCSQLSQAVTAPPVTKATTNGSSNTHLDSSTSATPNGKPRSFLFKRPATASSLVSNKPSSYTSAVVETKKEPSIPAISNAVEPQAMQSSQFNGDIDMNAVDVATLRKQVSDLVRKQHAHEGEIKWLRTTLKDKEAHVNKVRTSLSAESARQRLEHSERERAFIKDIETLRSDLQFKESELISASQALEKLKRERAKPVPPVMKLDADGFPAASAAFNGTALPSRVVVKSRSLGSNSKFPTGDGVAITGSTTVTKTEPSDLKPKECNRLTPRGLTAGQYRRKIIISEMLRSNMETIKHQLKSIGTNIPDSNQSIMCSQLLNDGIEYSRQLHFL